MRFLTLLLTIATLIFADVDATKTVSFDINDIQGNYYHITSTDEGLDIPSLKGKVVFLAFFGHRCPPCRMEMPGFVEFTNDKDYAKKAVILAFEVQGLDEDGVKSFAKDQGLNYRLVAGSKYPQFIDYIGYKTNWNWGIPFMIVLNSDGKVVSYGNGIVGVETLKSLANEFFVEAKDKNITKQ